MANSLFSRWQVWVADLKHAVAHRQGRWQLVCLSLVFTVYTTPDITFKCEIPCTYQCQMWRVRFQPSCLSGRRRLPGCAVLPLRESPDDGSCQLHSDGVSSCIDQW